MSGPEGWSRRTFLRSLGATGAVVAAGAACSTATQPGAGRAGAGPPTAPPPTAPPTTAPPATSATSAVTSVRPRPDAASARRVVVVGAGLAGLTAALDLEAQGWDVVVLEARDRVGGRVHTLTAPFSPGLHVEAGGESIDDNHDAILALVDRFGLSTERRPADGLASMQVFREGRRRPIADVLAGRGGRVLEDHTRASEALSALAEDLDPAHPERFARAEELDGRSLAGFLDDLDLVPEARFLFETSNRGEYNAELRDLSLLFVLQQEAVVRDVPDAASETMRLRGGNARLVEAMRDALAKPVVLGSPVTQIEWDDGGVRVTSTTRTDAARLVIALPTPPLRRITFAPSLPGELGQAIAELDLGTAVKVATEYRLRFWNELRTTGFTLTDLPFQIAWAATDSSGSRDDPGVLTQFITGDAAVRAAAMSDDDRMRTFGAELDEVFPEGISSRGTNQATLAWANEPFTGGGYSVFRPGQLATFWPAIRRGVGPISFAGEHTETLAGFMESAVRSGHRVAREIGASPP
jgi:monoamine oxidase